MVDVTTTVELDGLLIGDVCWDVIVLQRCGLCLESSIQAGHISAFMSIGSVSADDPTFDGAWSDAAP